MMPSYYDHENEVFVFWILVDILDIIDPIRNEGYLLAFKKSQCIHKTVGYQNEHK